jgi:hypothetical protein
MEFTVLSRGLLEAYDDEGEVIRKERRGRTFRGRGRAEGNEHGKV